MGNYIYHVLFDTYRVDIPQPTPTPLPTPPPTYYETSVAWELFKYIGMFIIYGIVSIILALGFLIRGATRWS
jgi:hypothetical protein